MTDAKGEWLGAGPWGAPTILNVRRMMANQSLFSPASSVLLQVLILKLLKTRWHRTKIRIRFKLCFHVIIYSKDTDNSIAVPSDAIGRCNRFEQLVDTMQQSMLKVFLLITERLMKVLRSYLFSAEMRSFQYLLLRWCSRGPGTTLCATR